MVAKQPPHGMPLPNTDERTRNRIAARRAVQMFEPMLAQFLSQIEIIFTDGKMCFTDGKRIYISDAFVKKMPRGDVLAIYHEMWHIAFGHLPMFRAVMANDWEHSLYNVLTDAKINEQAHHRINFSSKEWEKISKTGIVTLENVCKIIAPSMRKGWEDALKDVQLTDTIRAFNALKPYMIKPIELGEDVLMEGAGALGSSFNDDIKRDVETKIAASIQAAKMRGTSGGSLESELEELWLNPQVPWARIIAQAVLSRFRREKTWSRFHKKTYYIT